LLAAGAAAVVAGAAPDAQRQPGAGAEAAVAPGRAEAAAGRVLLPAEPDAAVVVAAAGVVAPAVLPAEAASQALPQVSTAAAGFLCGRALFPERHALLSRCPDPTSVPPDSMEPSSPICFQGQACSQEASQQDSSRPLPAPL